MFLIPKLQESKEEKLIPNELKITKFQHKILDTNGNQKYILTSDGKGTLLCDNLSIQDLKATDEMMDYFIDSSGFKQVRKTMCFIKMKMYLKLRMEFIGASMKFITW